LTTWFGFHVCAFLLLAGIVGAAYGSYDRLAQLADAIRRHSRPLYTGLALLAVCVALSAFILYFGNRQFGGFDQSVMVEAGWRLHQGQLPYRDFICTMPPGFFLGVKWADALFGVSWDAMLYACAIFSCVTFLWTFALLRKLLDDELAAFWIAFCIQDAAMLTMCFWHHSNVTSITAAVFFLSCWLYLQQPDRAGSSASYVASLALLGLMKPNVALPLIGMAGALMLVATPARAWWKLALLTLAGLGGFWGILAANGVSLGGMIASYRAVAVERGFAAYGTAGMPMPDAVRVIICLIGFSAPFVVWGPRFWEAWRTSDIRALAKNLLWMAAPITAAYAMVTNRDIKDVEWPLLLCSGAVLMFTAARLSPKWLTKFYVCFLITLSALDLYLGVVRYRIALIADFYAWEGRLTPPGIPFFEHMEAGDNFGLMVRQMSQVLKDDKQSVFFGPRMEFGYAAFRRPSPRHLPIWWHPGSSFVLTDEPRILTVWSASCFDTLIFARNDFTYYSPSFINVIWAHYERLPDQAEWSELTIFHRKSGGCKLASGGSPNNAEENDDSDLPRAPDRSRLLPAAALGSPVQHSALLP